MDDQDDRGREYGTEGPPSGPSPATPPPPPAAPGPATAPPPPPPPPQPAPPPPQPAPPPPPPPAPPPPPPEPASFPPFNPPPAPSPASTSAAPPPRPSPPPRRTAPAPSRAVAAPPPTRRRPRPDDEAAEYDEYDDEYDDEYSGPSRWATLVSTVGMAVIGIIAVQVLASVVQGLTIKTGERLGQGLRDDLFHRLGYPFDNLGSTALLFLALGVVLLALPSALDESVAEPQDRAVGIMLKVAIVIAVIVAIGSVLAVRATLHNYSANNVAVPTSVRIQFTTFLLGALGAAALSLYGAISALGQRARDRWED